MKDQPFKNMIFDEEGDAVTRQQLIDSYYDGTTESKKKDADVVDGLDVN